MAEAAKKYIGVRDDFFSKPLFPTEAVALMGSRCSACGEVFLGTVFACQNCQSAHLKSIPLSRDGTLFSYTVVRNRPPGDYKGPDNPFQPYPVGLVELPDGVRILSVLDCELGALKIGMPLTLCIYELYDDEMGRTVLSYQFKAADKERRQ
jgi:uncharacterized OB-fold protein